jgi:hypothetical protein
LLCEGAVFVGGLLVAGYWLPRHVCASNALFDAPLFNLCDLLVTACGFLQAAGGWESCMGGAFAGLCGSAFGEFHVFCGDRFFAWWWWLVSSGHGASPEHVVFIIILGVPTRCGAGAAWLGGVRKPVAGFAGSSVNLRRLFL